MKPEDYLSNIKKIYLFSFFWMFLVLIPVLVPYFLTKGLSMEQVFQLQALFGLSCAILEVPSGYLSDLWGRKNTLVVGAFISGLGFTWMFFAETFLEFVVFEIIIGISLSLVSGTDISILFDSLKHVSGDERAKSTKAVANIQLAQVGAESIASVIGGLLVKISFKAVILCHALVNWMPFFVALTIKEPEYEKMDKDAHWENTKKIFKHLFRSDRLLTLIFINLVIWGLSTFIAVWLFQKYWQDNNIPLSYFGFLWAGYNLSVGVIGKQVHWLENKFGPYPLLISCAIFPIVGYFGMAFTVGWIGVLFGLAFQVGRGVTNVIFVDALNWRVPSEFRATANSLRSLFFRLGFVIVGPAVGYIVDKSGTAKALEYVGYAFLVLLFAALIPLIIEIKKTNIRTFEKS